MDSQASAWVVGAHTIATALMFGVIWTVQVVHYPLFARVPADAFGAYERDHMRRIGWVVGPAMIAELAAAVAIAAMAGSWGIDPGLAWAGVGLVAVIWVSTAVGQAPMHGRLARGKDDALIARLVRTNWVRTSAWSVRMVIAVVMAMSVRGGIA